MSEQGIRAFCEKIPDTRVRRATTMIFADVFRAVFGREIGGASLRAFVASWLNRLQAELASRSYDKYKQIAEAFVSSLGPAADRDITTFGPHDDGLVLQFRDDLAARVAPSVPRQHDRK
jgi:hypothetical protein